jgi:serine/threonine-protein kinase RsbW
MLRFNSAWTQGENTIGRKKSMMSEPEYRLQDVVLRFQATIESCRDLLASECDRIMGIAKTLPCVHGDLSDLHLALLEAMVNAVIHGNHEDSAKRVGICAGCTGRGQLLISVTDEGYGFDPAALPDPTYDVNIDSTHGRGVFLMKHLVDDVRFNLGGRQVVRRKRMC